MPQLAFQKLNNLYKTDSMYLRIAVLIIGLFYKFAHSSQPVNGLKRKYLFKYRKAYERFSAHIEALCPSL